MMKFICTIAMSVIAALSLFVLNYNSSLRETDTYDLAHIRKNGYLRVLMNANTPSYFFYKGRPLGYEYELASSLAKHLDVKLKITLVSSADEAVHRLLKKEADLIAMPIAITADRKKNLRFTSPFFHTRQVMVRRKTGVAAYSPIATPIVYSPSVESPINLVAKGIIPFAVTDEYLASLFAHVMPGLDVSTVLYEGTPVAWSMRPDASALFHEIAAWKKSVKKTGYAYFVFKKYFDMPRRSSSRIISPYSSLSGKKISPYDDMLKRAGKSIRWDWRLLASIVNKESHFNPEAESHCGAIGLMQVRPSDEYWETETNLFQPEINIRAGAHLLASLDKYWKHSVQDSTLRIKFILASYNVGLTHVQDAYSLAKKHNDSISWEDSVFPFLLKKSRDPYRNDPVVKAGRCNCPGALAYVNDVLHYYNEYQNLYR